MTYDIELVDRAEQVCAVVPGHARVEEIAGFVSAALGEVMQAVGGQGVVPTGPPFARYTSQGSREWDVEVGFPVSGAVTPAGRVRAATLPGGRAARTLHVGDYGGVGAAYESLQTWLSTHGYVVSGAPWECYLDGPEVARPRTEVYFPCRTADVPV